MAQPAPTLDTVCLQLYLLAQPELGQEDVGVHGVDTRHELDLRPDKFAPRLVWDL